MVRRSCYIWGSAAMLGAKLALLRRRGLRGAELVGARKQLAADLRDTLIRLGPTFIKVGQLLSTRVDVFAPEVIEEQKLEAQLDPPCPGPLVIGLVNPPVVTGFKFEEQIPSISLPAITKPHPVVGHILIRLRLPGHFAVDHQASLVRPA